MVSWMDGMGNYFQRMEAARPEKADTFRPTTRAEVFPVKKQMRLKGNGFVTAANGPSGNFVFAD
jgi:hypothetical protein